LTLRSSPMDRPPHSPNGCHIAEVEVDPDTGVVEVVRYSFSVMINPLLVNGQAHGRVQADIL
jgi:carbon-monoxide dehydrogenase large subunit